MERTVLRTPKVAGAKAAAEEKRVAVIRSFMMLVYGGVKRSN
jgi:hypothetical protein